MDAICHDAGLRTRECGGRDTRCTQFVNPTFTYIAKIAKEFLPPV